VRKTRILEGKSDFLQSFAHLTESSLLVRFASRPLFDSYYSRTPSIFVILLFQNYGVLRLIQVHRCADRQQYQHQHGRPRPVS
jgi:hypothetical protein